MKKMKRVLCPVLVTIMLFVLTTVRFDTAQAFADVDQIVHVEAVNRAAELGYFVGSDGKFMPKDTVTRAQMATVIVKMLHGADFNASGYKNMGRFPDTVDFQGGWADGYINLCAQDGVVGGYGDGTFKPEKKVNTAEAVTMILNAVKVNAGEGNWPDTVMSRGAALGFFDELEGVVWDTALNREQLAVLVIAGVDWQETQKEQSEQSTQPKQPKPEQPKPEQTKPEQTKPEQTKPEQTKPEWPKPEEPEQPKETTEHEFGANELPGIRA